MEQVNDEAKYVCPFAKGCPYPIVPGLQGIIRRYTDEDGKAIYRCKALEKMKNKECVLPLLLKEVLAA